MKSTVDIATGYDATNRGTILKEQRRGTGRVIGFVVLSLVMIGSAAVHGDRAEAGATASSGLLVNFMALASMYLTLHAEFLAVIQIVVYSGAILILFVFVIALLSSGDEAVRAGPEPDAARIS